MARTAKIACRPRVSSTVARAVPAAAPTTMPGAQERRTSMSTEPRRRWESTERMDVMTMVASDVATHTRMMSGPP